jgi:mono/diheme cytochrome c family protein
MTRDPVAAKPLQNDLSWPLGFRPLLAGWNFLFLDKTPWTPQAGRSAEWNRGAYLAEGLAHCGACHSPLDALGAEEAKRHFDGGEAEGWYVPAINAHSPSPQPWSVDQLTTYLRTGIVADHAMAGGPMQGVVNLLAQADEADVRAIAVYVESQMGEPDAGKTATATASKARAARGPLAMARSAGAIDPPAGTAAPDDATLALGASVYAGACASCHDKGREISSNGALPLPLAVAVYEPDPRSLIHIVRDGIQPLNLQPGRWMPAFAGSLDDTRMIALLTYLRHQAADAPPWPDLASQVAKAKSP